MPKMKLTSAAVEKMRPPASGRAEVFDTTMPAFGLRVSSSGVKSYILMTRVRGKLVRLTVGRAKTAPDGPGLSLADARRRAGEMQEVAANGDDPRELKAAEKAKREERARNTFGAVAEEFWEKHVRRNVRPGTQREYKRALFGADTAAWKDRPVSSITRRDVHDVVDAIVGRGSAGAAGRVLAYLSRFFNWCQERDLVEVPPTMGVRQPSKINHRDRVLTTEEVGDFWRATDDLGWPFGPLFRLLLLTGARRTEVAAATWNEFDIDGERLWTIPAERAKNGLAHLVPLSAQASAILDDLPRFPETALVFTTGRQRRKDGAAPEPRPVSGFGRAKERVDELMLAARRKRVADAGGDPDRVELEPWRLHDLRRTAATRMAEAGVPVAIVEKTIAHKSGTFAGIVGVYQRQEYLPERRDALQAWADEVERHGAAEE